MPPVTLPITYINVILIYIPVRSAGGGLTDYFNLSDWRPS